jgi:rSAM/selenodomain-associated transferase 2/rSAM/selenodomain-associated transferase 1
VPTLSIVVPVLDEAAAIGAALAALQPFRARGGELIVVDGGSRDGTAELATPLADRVLVAPRGRAQQMNAGAAAAAGDTLLFVHADTTLPEDADAQIAAALADGAHWGRFDVAIVGRHRLLPLVAWAMNRRSRLTGIATGDQAIFVDRATFIAAGGFPDQPLMEDIALSAALRRHSRPACLRGPVLTSGRRWDAKGFWHTVLLMWRLRWAYWRGADPALLARRYGYARAEDEAGAGGLRGWHAPGAASLGTGTPGFTAERQQRADAAARVVSQREERVALLVFAKAPVPGAVKTRLIPALGADGAARLAERLLERTLATAAAGRFSTLQLWCAPDAEHPALQAAAARHGATLHVQQGADLGERMQAALAEALATHPAALLIGTDCPGLSPEDLRKAAAPLQGPRDVAIIPAEDGGYVLIGMTRPNPALFAGVGWGGPQVLAQTRARAAAAGLRLHLGEVRRDLDTPDDLADLDVAALLAD